MAISTDTAIEYFGTQDSLAGTGAVSDGSYDPISGTWTNDDDAVMASAVLSCSFSTNPTANTSISLFAQLYSVQSTNNSPTPTDDVPHVYLGSFPVAQSISQQYISIEIGLPNTKTSQEYKFYIKNNCGQQIDSDWTIYITPKAIGPSA